MHSDQEIKSSCAQCPMGCGILVRMVNGQPVEVKGDPDAPYNKGMLCVKGQASLEALFHPDRLKHPLKRVGERGEGKWQEVSWDEALSFAAGQLNEAKNNHGVESVAVVRGGAKGYQDGTLRRFANSLVPLEG